jgi:hypothetical protein
VGTTAKYNHNTSLFGALNEVFENNSLNNLMVNLIQYYPSSPLCNKEKIIELHKQRKVQKTEQQHLTHLNQVRPPPKRFDCFKFQPTVGQNDLV